MKGRERRSMPERYETKGCQAVLFGNPEEQTDVLNLNRRGVLLPKTQNPDGKVNISLVYEKDNKILIEKRPCSLQTISRKISNNGTTENKVAIFANELTKLEFTHFNECAKATEYNNPRLWSLMLSDKEDIKEEVLHIQRCRSDMFLAIVTALFLTIVTVGCLLTKEYLNMGGLLVASVASFFMFILGVYTTIEKAKGINERRGFLANLTDYIVQGNMPISYQGWAKMRKYFHDCGILRRLNSCPLKLPPKPNWIKKKLIKSKIIQQPEPINDTKSDQTNITSCRSHGSKIACRINKAKAFMPGVSSSFMSFTSYVYSILYFFSIFVFCIVLLQYIDSSPTENGGDLINTWKSWPLLIFLSIGVISSLTFLMRFRKLMFFTGVIALITLGFIVRISDVKVKDYYLLAVLIYIGVGFFMGSIGAYLLRSLYFLRKGKYSVESYYYSWQQAILNCCSLTDISSNYKGGILQRLQSLLWGD